MYRANLDYKVTEHENCEFLYHIFFRDEIIKCKRRCFTVLFQSKHLNSRELKPGQRNIKEQFLTFTTREIVKFNLEIIIYICIEFCVRII